MNISFAAGKKPQLWSTLLCGSALACISISHTGCHRAVAKENPIPTSVAAARVVRGNLANELVFSAELRPWYAVELHAKVAGFVKTLSVDLGSRVKSGEVLAELEIPLLAEDIAGARAQLRRNQSEVERAEAAYDDAHLSYTRLEAVAKADPKLLAQQEIDSALEKDRDSSASLTSEQQQVQVARAGLDRMLAEEADTRLVAPFDGVVTELDANPGDLVQGGTSPSGQGKPLVRFADISHLRATFPVPTSNISQVHVGMPVTIRLDDGRRLQTKIARIGDDVSSTTRTMQVEADLPNEDLSLIPGMYASAVIAPEHRENTLIVPVQAIQPGARPKLWVVNAMGNVEERLVKLGLEMPDQVEVLEGVKEGEIVLVGNPGGGISGQKVEPHFVAAIAQN